MSTTRVLHTVDFVIYHGFPQATFTRSANIKLYIIGFTPALNDFSTYIFGVIRDNFKNLLFYGVTFTVVVWSTFYLVCTQAILVKLA